MNQPTRRPTSPLPFQVVILDREITASNIPEMLATRLNLSGITAIDSKIKDEKSTLNLFKDRRPRVAIVAIRDWNDWNNFETIRTSQEAISANTKFIFTTTNSKFNKELSDRDPSTTLFLVPETAQLTIVNEVKKLLRINQEPREENEEDEGKPKKER